MRTVQYRKWNGKSYSPYLLIQHDLSGSSECRRLVDNLIGQILDWNQRGWNGNVLNFFVRSLDWQNFEFCNHYWGKIGNGNVFLPILGLRAGLVSIMHYCRSSLAIIHLMCFIWSSRFYMKNRYFSKSTNSFTLCSKVGLSSQQ